MNLPDPFGRLMSKLELDLSFDSPVKDHEEHYIPNPYLVRNRALYEAHQPKKWRTRHEKQTILRKVQPLTGRRATRR